MRSLLVIDKVFRSRQAGKRDKSQIVFSASVGEAFADNLHCVNHRTMLRAQVSNELHQQDQCRTHIVLVKLVVEADKDDVFHGLRGTVARGLNLA